MSKTIKASTCTVLHLDAGHTPNGNPKRLFLVLSEGEVVGALDEGYLGTGALDGWGKEQGKILRAHLVSDRIKISKSEHKRLVNEAPFAGIVAAS